MSDWIDYSGESTDDKPDLWSAKAFKMHFIQSYWEHHQTGGAIPWTMKEQVLLSKMIQEFDTRDLASLITYWHKTTRKSSVASNFTNFYSQRIELWNKMIDEDKDFSWN